jgi:L,D-peptidoglycan transpeptidase YkuD (ErfK/YbiS/YcfS/YnhG family)
VALAAVALAGTGCSGVEHDAEGSSSSATVSGAPASSAGPGPGTTPTRTSASVSVSALPLHLSTGDAGQVITVTAASSTSTTGTLRAWRRVAGGWRPVGPRVIAYLGADGIGQASEQSSRTPAGSYTLTQAFGHDADPGTALPYVHTTAADWWISEAGPLYNTRQHCSSGCGFTQGAPNEPLYETMPFYRYAVVIDYNTRNAPGGVQAGSGSAFFLHVAVGEPTQGCVAIAQDQLVRLLRWLTPAQHPRILIGVV